MRFFYIILLFILSVSAFSQQLSNLRISNIALNSDTIRLDTLSLVPNSIFISDNSGHLIADSLFQIDHAKGLLIVKKTARPLLPENVKISYRTFPLSFTKPYFHKDFSKINITQGNVSNPYKISYEQSSKGSFFDKDELDKRGSISRGITFGNNQDVIVNSNLNLQLSGKINDNLEILAAITDNNIPIQPDGNSQQIQEFDKVFVQLFNKKMKLTVGDYELTKPIGYYMNLLKKVQGAMFSTTVDVKKEKGIKLKTSFSGAIAKGKYNKLSITGIEGNQGPYKLTGAENETYIIVLAGTETVYIDGKILKRGQENDYTIDYNTGEVTFTPNQPITKDKRISIEFQYSDKSYARFLFMNSNELQTKKGRLWINLFSEQDSKNQPLDVTLSDPQKLILGNAGDSVIRAIVPKVDSVAFRNDMVLYKRIDTTVTGIRYDSIYVYSTNADSAHYRLGFSFVGDNKGNYVQVSSSANGRVYRWIAPYGGIRQGNFEPVILLVTPKKKQMLTIGNEYKITSKTRSTIEFAMTDNDVNTFATKDKGNDIGYAIKAGFIQDLLTKDTVNLKLQTSLSYQLITREFDPIERFRSVEFSRDWNLAPSGKQDNEQQLSYDIYFFKNKLGTAKYNLDWMVRKQGYTGIKNAFSSNFKTNGFSLLLKASLLNSTDLKYKTSFLRHSASISKDIKFVIIGLREEQENNIWASQSTDSLQKNSFRYSQYEAFAKTPDSMKTGAFINYKIREDRLPKNNELSYAMSSKDLNLGTIFQKNPNNTVKTTFNYRELAINDSSLTKNKAESTVSGRLEHNLNIIKGVVTTSTFYEIGSGLEIKKEFSYLQVAQGQGVYTWTDYNNNGIKELNEFEVAVFQDKADYIRIFTPTNQYIKTYSNQFSQTINLRPERMWGDKSGLRKIVAAFSDQLAYRIDRKDARNDFWKTANPFYQGFNPIADNDTSIVSIGSSIRNTFSFNRSHPIFGIDYVYQDNQNKALLVNGFDTRINTLNGLRIRWNINKFITWLDNCDVGNKEYSSQYFSSKNYKISYLNNEATFSIQPGLAYRISLSYKFSEKQNKLHTEKSQGHNVGLEYKYNTPTKGSITVNINYIKLTYKTGEEALNTNTSIAYEMLEGMMPGNNGTWGVQFQRNLNKVLQMSLNYTGRKSEGNNTVHTGSVQIRAAF